MSNRSQRVHRGRWVLDKMYGYQSVRLSLDRPRSGLCLIQRMIPLNPFLVSDVIT